MLVLQLRVLPVALFYVCLVNTADPSFGAIEDICSDQLSRPTTVTTKKLTTNLHVATYPKIDAI